MSSIPNPNAGFFSNNEKPKTLGELLSKLHHMGAFGVLSEMDTTSETARQIRESQTRKFD